MLNLKILDIYSGKEELFIKNNKEFNSAYKKISINDKVFVNYMGLENDIQSDKKHHGGEHKAICVFTQIAYEHFEEKYNLNLDVCSFGENITLDNIEDKDICLADRFSIGEIIVEVSQPREPCFKISSIIGIKELTSLVLKENKTGFYLRIIKEGFISKNDTFKLISRKYEKINIEFINQVLRDYKNKQKEILEILECEELAPAFRKTLEKKLIK
ncbi:MAG: MOSC domain-containing protein [Campylobacteraceae bacterium]|nr:MOSC domain-containing protein [Campylobacteraceae bacterium]